MRGDYYYEWWLHEEDFGRDFKLLLAKMCDGDALMYMTPAGEWVKYEPGQHASEPTIRLHRPAMEALAMRMLQWAGERGMRTEPEAKLQGQLEATKYHLEDMRTLLKLGGNK